MPKAIWEQFSQSPVQQEDTSKRLRPAADQQVRVVEVLNRINLINFAPRPPLFSRRTPSQVLNPPYVLDPKTMDNLVAYWTPSDISAAPYKVAASVGSDRSWNLGNNNGAVPSLNLGNPYTWTLTGKKTLYPIGATSTTRYPFNSSSSMGLVLRNIVHNPSQPYMIFGCIPSSSGSSLVIYVDTDGSVKMIDGSGLALNTPTAIGQLTASSNTIGLIITTSQNIVTIYLNSVTVSGTSFLSTSVGTSYLSGFQPAWTNAMSMDVGELFFFNKKLTSREIAGINNYWRSAYGVGVAS